MIAWSRWRWVAVVAGLGALGPTVAALRAAPRITFETARAPLLTSRVVEPSQRVAIKPGSSAPSAAPNPVGVADPAMLARKLRVTEAARLARAALGDAPGADAASLASSAPTPSVLIEGIRNSAAICPPRSCAPPDQALAVSDRFVVQGVNRAFAVYDKAGHLQPGWPVSAQSFFGVPDYCGAVPLLADPRLMYDPTDRRFWAVMLQPDQKAGCGLGVKFWVAVSRSDDPRGAWNVYSVDVADGSGYLVDFTEVGFDQRALYVAGNQYDTAHGGNFVYASVFAIEKSALETGNPPKAAAGFRNMSLDGTPLDTVHPAATLPSRTVPDPGVEFLVSSQNINFGGGTCVNACNGVVVWALADGGSATPRLSGRFVPTRPYSIAPNGQQPGGAGGIDTGDTRISATPLSRDGVVTFALNTGAVGNNAAVFWGQIRPRVSRGALVGASVVQQGNISLGTLGEDVFYGAPALDSADNVVMALGRAGPRRKPELDVAVRRAHDSAGTFGSPRTVRAGVCVTQDTRWGDFFAATADPAQPGVAWIGGAYGGACPLGTWQTALAAIPF